MFYPDIAATSKVLTDLAVELSLKNHEVSVLASNRDYNEPNKVYKNNEVYKNIDIRRYNVPLLDKNKIISRIILSYLVQRNFSREFKLSNPEICFAVSNPPNMALAAARISTKKNIPFVFILHDLYPDVLVKTGKISKNSFIANQLQKVTSKTFDMSTKIIVLGRDAADYVHKHYTVSKDKIEVIPNWGPASTSVKKTGFREKMGFEGKFILLYSGNIGETADFDTLLEAASKTEDPDILYLIVGKGKMLRKLEEKTKKSRNVRFLDFLPEDDYLAMLSEVDAFFVSLKKDLYGISIPSKTYYYLSAGKPVIGMLPENSEIDLLLKEKELGMVCNDYNANTLLGMIQKLKNKNIFSQEKILKTYNESLTKEKVMEKYSSLLKEIEN